MKIQLIRNATLKLDINGRTILIDPYFAPKHSLESFTGKSPNPLVELPVSIDEIIDGVEFVVVSHLHSDHFDELAKTLVPKHLPLICQPGDEDTIRAAGFENVTPLNTTMEWSGITFTREEGSHGLGPVVDDMGPVMGVKIEAAGEPRLYWAGDTVFYPVIRENIGSIHPDIIVIHACGAKWDGDLIVMNADQAVAVCEAAPGAIVVATHMEALDHATTSRDDLRKRADDAGLDRNRLVIPADGETLTFSG
ncbi:MAG: fold metallo-hydrolase [Rhizobium sp.]|nr:fold metallo-hydrolase [Rhizobium sp.]